MTTHHEAPTLDEQIAIMQSVVDGAKEFPECFRVSDAAILASLERLRAIENAKGMPEEPVSVQVMRYEFSQTHDAEVVAYIDALRLYAQHLQDRPNRIEALLRESSEEMELAGAPHCKNNLFTAMMVWKAMSAALLAKLEGRE